MNTQTNKQVTCSISGGFWKAHLFKKHLESKNDSTSAVFAMTHDGLHFYVGWFQCWPLLNLFLMKPGKVCLCLWKSTSSCPSGRKVENSLGVGWGGASPGGGAFPRLGSQPLISTIRLPPHFALLNGFPRQSFFPDKQHSQMLLGCYSLYSILADKISSLEECFSVRFARTGLTGPQVWSSEPVLLFYSLSYSQSN